MIMFFFIIGVVACEEGCTGSLFQELDAMSRSVSKIYWLTDYVPLPWNNLLAVDSTSLVLHETLTIRVQDSQLADRIANAPNLLPLAQITLQRSHESQSQSVKVRTDAADLQPHCAQRDTQVTRMESELRRVIDYLKNYAIGETPSTNVYKALAEAENHLKYIQSLDGASARQANAQRELDRSRKLLDSVRNLFVDTSGAAHLRDNLEGFKIRLEDIDHHIGKSNNNTVLVIYCKLISMSFFIIFIELTSTGDAVSGS